jgi:hypothetical protein
MEWSAAGPKVGTAACLSSRSVEENYLNSSVDSGTLGYTRFAGRWPACAKPFPEYGDPRGYTQARCGQPLSKIVDGNGGKTYDESFQDFTSKYETMADATGWNLQMMHY